MRTFWIKTRNTLALRPGDKVQIQNATGGWVELEVAYARPEAYEMPTFHGPAVRTATGETEIELIAPAGGIDFRAGSLIRAGGCTWALDRDYHIGSVSQRLVPGAYIPPASAFQGHNLADVIQNSLETNRINWSSGGKEKLILAIAKEFADECDMFIGFKSLQTLPKIEAKLDELTNFIKRLIPPFEFDQIYPEICKIITRIVEGIRHENNTNRFRREYLGHPGYACVCGERVAKKKIIMRPDAPWKLDS